MAVRFGMTTSLGCVGSWAASSSPFYSADDVLTLVRLRPWRTVPTALLSRSLDVCIDGLLTAIRTPRLCVFFFSEKVH